MSGLLSLPDEILSLILSFVSLSSAEIDAVTPLAPRLNASDAVWKSLCLLAWRVDEQRFAQWPTEIGSFRNLYRVLERWAPREGFYVALEAFPYGHIVLMRFDNGRFVGDSLWPSRLVDSGEVYQRSRILEITFDGDGDVAQATLCGAPCAVDFLEGDAPLESLSLQPGAWPINGQMQWAPVTASAGCMRFSVADEAFGALRAGAEAGGSEVRFSSRVWRPHFEGADGLQLFRSLLHLQFVVRQERAQQPATSRPPGAIPGMQLTLRFEEGPRRKPAFAYDESMPVVRPGLYTASYSPAHYGQFSRECILIEYVVMKRGEGEEPGDDGFWRRVKDEMFGGDTRADPGGIFEGLRAEVAAGGQRELLFLVGRKVTGDYHVPMGELSFCALISPLRSSADGVQPGSRIGERGAAGGGSRRSYIVEDAFPGWGTLAFPGFHQPSWDHGTIVRAQNLIGFVWTREQEEAAMLRWLPDQDSYPWFLNGG